MKPSFRSIISILDPSNNYFRKSLGELVTKSALLWLEALWKIFAFQIMVFLKTVMQQGAYIGTVTFPKVRSNQT